MNDLTGAATEAARQENTEKILDTAERLFRHYGYNKTNVADIARELSMSSGNIYRFFASKADIQQALVRRMLAAQFQAVKAQAAGPGTATERLKQHLILVHKMTVETMLDEEKVHEMVVVAMDQQWPVIQEHLQQIRLVVTDLIREGIAAGEFRPERGSCGGKLHVLRRDALSSRTGGQEDGDRRVHYARRPRRFHHTGLEIIGFRPAGRLR